MASTYIYPLQAQFRPRQQVELAVKNPPSRYTLTVTRLEKAVWERRIEGRERVCVGSWPEGGYGVTLTQGDIRATTAFDVAARPAAYPRYGFLSDFFTDDRLDDTDIEFLLRCHINLVQFYDWMYRHHELVPKQTLFTDPMGRELDFETIRHKLSACHVAGMKCMAYGSIYGAEKEYGHPEQVMLRANGRPMRLIGFIDMMDFEAGGPWAAHIIREFQNAMKKVGFDGIHLDQYGFPKYSYRGHTSENEVFDVENAFGPFLRQVRSSLPDAILIFNAVNNWPIRNVANAPIDAVYIEVWKPYDTYFYLQKLIQDARQLSGDKPVILASYLKPFSKDSTCSEETKMAAFELAQAAIYGNGGNQLILGEHNGVLQDAYYCDYGILPDPEKAISYADFQVRYRDLLFDRALRPAGHTYCGEGNGDLYIEGVPVSCDGRPGTVWVLVNKKPGMKVLHLINLTDQADASWNAGKRPVEPLRDLNLWFLCEKISGVFLASPEKPELAPVVCERVENRDDLFYRLHIPELNAWCMLVLFHYESGCDTPPPAAIPYSAPRPTGR